MATIHNQTESLLLKLKQKRFNSQNEASFESVNVNGLKNAFLCSYHPSEIITNFCISQSEDKPKPLCPKCLQQHIKFHHDQNSICRLQTSESELIRISLQLNEKLNRCQTVNQKIQEINEWKVQSIDEIKSDLRKYKKQVIESIQSLFKNLEIQFTKRYKQKNNDYEQTVKVMQTSIPDLKQICSRTISFLNQKKDLNSIILSLPQITEKYQNFINNEKKMIQNCSINHEFGFNKSKLAEAINIIRSSIEYKFNKINEIELEKNLRKSKAAKQQQIKQQQEKFQKTQLILQQKSSSKLFTIQVPKGSEFHSIKNSSQKYYFSTVPSSPRGFIQTSRVQTIKQQSPNQDIFTRLNETSNRLKSSLKEFSRTKQQ